LFLFFLVVIVMQHRFSFSRFFSHTALALMLIASMSSVAVAQVSGNNVRTMTLEDCLRIAAGENLDVLNQRAQISSAQSQIGLANAEYLPTVSIATGWQRNLFLVSTPIVVQGVVIGEQRPADNNFNASLRINYNVFDGFNREGNIDQAKAGFEATTKNAQFTLQRILNSVRAQYITVMRAQQVLGVRKQDVETGKQQLTRVRAQFEAGTIPVANVYTQEADNGNREVLLVQAENDLEIAKNNLLTSLGMNAQQAINFASMNIPTSLSQNDMDQFRGSLGSFGQLGATALGNRGDYAVTRHNIEAAEGNLLASKSGWYPSVNLFGGWFWNGIEFSNFDRAQKFLSLSLSIPIFDGFRRDNRTQNAQAQLLQRQYDARSTELRISNELQNALTQLATAEKQVDVTTRAFKAADQNFNAADERYKVGAANYLDFVNANFQLTNARINRINALYNYVGAQYQIQFAMGTLDKQ
jgi:outer membrane protein